MLRARNRGRLLQGEADYQLHIIYLWYERQTGAGARAARATAASAIPAIRSSCAQIAEIQDTYQHDVTASLDTWRDAAAPRAREQRVNDAALAEVQARLGIARSSTRCT